MNLEGPVGAALLVVLLPAGAAAQTTAAEADLLTVLRSAAAGASAAVDPRQLGTVRLERREDGVFKYVRPPVDKMDRAPEALPIAGPPAFVTGVLETQLRSFTDQRVSELLARLSDERLAGMRGYIRAFVPPLPKPAWKSDVGACIREPDAESYLASLRSLFERVEKIDPLKLDLRISSDPEGASFWIAPLGGGTPSTSSTNSTLTNLYRGLYRYQVEKASFKTVEGTLNLVDERGDHLRCKLHSQDSAEGPLFCRLVEEKP
jgi:hypothetical protein